MLLWPLRGIHTCSVASPTPASADLPPRRAVYSYGSGSRFGAFASPADLPTAPRRSSLRTPLSPVEWAWQETDQPRHAGLRHKVRDYHSGGKPERSPRPLCWGVRQARSPLLLWPLRGIHTCSVASPTPDSAGLPPRRAVYSHSVSKSTAVDSVTQSTVPVAVGRFPKRLLQSFCIQY